MTREELLAKARAASKRLDDANEELDAAERSHRVAWQEYDDCEDTIATSKSKGGDVQ